MSPIHHHFEMCGWSERKIVAVFSLVTAVLCVAGYSIVNIDATVVLQKPKIAPFKDTMTDNIARVLELDCGRINIKATTEERLGFTGREEGAAAHAVAVIKK